MELYELPENALIVKLRRSWRKDMTDADLYAATRGEWRIADWRTEDTSVVIGYAAGAVRSVYEVHEWQRGTELPRRWKFVGSATRPDLIGVNLPEVDTLRREYRFVPRLVSTMPIESRETSTGRHSHQVAAYGRTRRAEVSLTIEVNQQILSHEALAKQERWLGLAQDRNPVRPPTWTDSLVSYCLADPWSWVVGGVVSQAVAESVRLFVARLGLRGEPGPLSEQDAIRHARYRLGVRYGIAPENLRLVRVSTTNTFNEVEFRDDQHSVYRVVLGEAGSGVRFDLIERTLEVGE